MVSSIFEDTCIGLTVPDGIHVDMDHLKTGEVKYGLKGVLAIYSKLTLLFLASEHLCMWSAHPNQLLSPATG